jgi:chorismate-pyruvate lyase
MTTNQLHLPFTTAADLETLAHPMDAFYAEAGLPLPPIQRVEGQTLPQPMRDLLVHCNDMTPTLEAFYDRAIHLKVLQRRQHAHEYHRQVILQLNESGEPIEFGANRIRLDLFPESAQRMILEEREPLGHILRDHSIVHTCEPNAFFRVASDRLISEALRLRGAQILFGRHNRLFNPQGQLISEVVEILRPPVSVTG